MRTGVYVAACGYGTGVGVDMDKIVLEFIFMFFTVCLATSSAYISYFVGYKFTLWYWKYLHGDTEVSFWYFLFH